MTETLKEKSIRLEHFETPEWAANAILEKETTTNFIVDPCTGTGVLSDVAYKHKKSVVSIDIHDWGYAPQEFVCDFLKLNRYEFKEMIYTDHEFTVFMNPPFKKACQFVEKAFELGARKIISFQRFSWYESKGRREFWEKYPPSRVYVCGERASCWRHDIPKDQRGSSTPTAHAWFVWDRNAPSGTLLGHIYKN